MKITRIEPVSIFWITPRYAGTNLSSKMAGYVKSIKFSLINNYLCWINNGPNISFTFLYRPDLRVQKRIYI